MYFIGWNAKKMRIRVVGGDALLGFFKYIKAVVKHKK